MIDIPSIADSLARIKIAKTDIIQAIIAKGVDVPEGTKIDGLATLIAQIGGDTPTGLPANTLRFKFSKSSYDPTTAYGWNDNKVGGDGTWTKVEGTEDNIWDWTYDNPIWGGIYDEVQSPFIGAFTDSDNEVEIIAAGDTSNVTNTSEMFSLCFCLKSICLFDTSNVTLMNGMFEMGDNYSLLETLPLFDTSNVTDFSYFLYGCTSLKEIPLFNTSKATDVTCMCAGCYYVESGALALYNQLSTQTNPPNSHGYCFSNCGSESETGPAELAQIPDDWK